jgi:hypothetical protein
MRLSKKSILILVLGFSAIASTFIGNGDSKAVDLLGAMQDVGAATDNYFMNTKTIIDRQSNDSSDVKYNWFKLSELVQSNKSGWSGPYVKYQKLGDNLSYDGSAVIKLANLRTDDGSWGGTKQDIESGICVSSKPCGVWVIISGLQTNEIAKTLDEEIDNNNGFDSGKFRVTINSSGTYEYSLLYTDVMNPYN